MNRYQLHTVLFLKSLDYLKRLSLSHQAMVNEYAVKSLTDRPAYQSCNDRRIDASA
jgi:hypothetical protein